ncbi:MAG TPA: hypothetical protein VFH33_03430, partial [Candidatus Krumholzibacteria bacterium]|nr:hypothetical protein [Candidatus Krumholzibacteria bacterium]
ADFCTTRYPVNKKFSFEALFGPSTTQEARMMLTFFTSPCDVVVEETEQPHTSLPSSSLHARERTINA